MTSVASVSFYPNRNGGSSKHAGTYAGSIIFPTAEFDQILVNNPDWVGRPVGVICTRFMSQNGPFFIADLQSGPVLMPEVNAFDQAPIVVVDAANFLNAAKNANVDPRASLERVLGMFTKPAARMATFYSPKEVKVHINRFHQMALVPGMKLVETPEKLVRTEGGSFSKSMVDMALAMYVSSLLATPRIKSKTLVLLSGDSDLAEAARMWLGLKGHNDYSHIGQQRQLVVMTSVGNISTEMRELSNEPRCRVILLDDLR